MCGLAGAYNTPVNVEQMLKRIEHRGRDGQGIYEHCGVTHGHVRLSLLDLSSASDQPFIYGDSVLSFNGEIWNFQDARQALQAKGHTFRTTGDTEVLAATIDLYGLDGLSHLEGMFAFCWSKGDDRWLVRDRFGEIPLYVAKKGKGYIWASERKAFDRGLIPIAVPPGYAFNLSNGQWCQWYKLPPSPDRVSVLSQLSVGVKHRMTADAPVCCLISGGLDSSAILALAREFSKDITAFTAKFSEHGDDLTAARRLCAQYEIRLIEVPVSIDIEAIRRALYCIEINSKAQVEIAALCIDLAKRVRAEGFKACLSGEAADELFGGYGNFCIQASKLSNEDIPKLRLKSLKKMSRGNFVRCNKAFMAGGVECRLPFMDLNLVEYAISLDKTESPLNKKLLKSSVGSLVPSWVIKRNKDTFQGGSGVSQWTKDNLGSPIRFYNSELTKMFKYLPKD